MALPPVISDQNFDQNYQKPDIEYEDEVVCFENDLFRDENPFDNQQFAPQTDNLEEKITLMNLVLDDVDEQKEAIQTIAKDDIVAKMNQKTLDWI